MKMRKTILIFLLLLPAGLWAHVFLDHAEPRVGSHMKASPTELKIWFTGEVEPAFSSIVVTDGDGKQIDKNDTHRDDKDKTLLIVSVPALPAGTYKVVWQAVATDTHKTSGDFKFTVDP